MSLFFAKSILSIVLGVAALVALLAMLSLMGSSERKFSAKGLRRTHRAAGWTVVAFIVVISYFCIKYVAAAGDGLSVRAVIHGALALALIVVLFLKILIVRRFKEFLRFAPVMGLIVFSLIFLVGTTSAGYYFVRVWCGPGTDAVTETTEAPPAETGDQEPRGDAEAGGDVYATNCAGCHNPAAGQRGIGPDLTGLMAGESLPVSGRAATRENVMRQLIDPVGNMPSFGSRLARDELADLVEYVAGL
jgi:mono/diheme cytochrome c family protein